MFEPNRSDDFCDVCWHDTLQVWDKEYDGGFACLGPAEWSCSTCGFFGQESGFSSVDDNLVYIEWAKITQDQLEQWRKGKVDKNSIHEETDR